MSQYVTALGNFSKGRYFEKKKKIFRNIFVTEKNGKNQNNILVKNSVTYIIYIQGE